MKILQTSYSRCLAVVAATYLTVYGALLADAGGMPYVCDANESFATLWHAYNLYHFDISKTCGITDDACSPDAAAHPFVHTHQGNFPRLFAFLIFVLGARTIESQVVVTTFTVGLASMLFAYHFLARSCTPRFALVACLFLMTDYLMIAQWQVVTYRVWHAFFIFSSLLCVRGAGSLRPRTWAALTFLNFLCLFYYEYVFVLFVLVSTGLYAGWLHRRMPSLAFRFFAWSTAGGALSVAIFVCQLVGYMGWHGLINDATTTITSRLYTRTGTPIPTEVSEFYENHHIIFFNNLFDGRALLNGRDFLSSFISYDLGPYTPLFVLVFLIVAAGWLGGRIVDGPCTPGPVWHRRGSRWPWLRLAGAFGFLVLCSHLFFVSLFRDHAYVGSLPVPPLALAVADMWVNITAFALAVGFCLIWSKRTTAAWWGLGQLHLGRIVMAGVLLVGLAWFVRNHGYYYWHELWAIWHAMRRLFYFRAGEQLVVAAALWLGIGLVLGGRRLVGRKALAPLGGLVPFLLCSATGVTVVFLLAGGYLLTGYMARWVSFGAYFTNTLIAVAVWLGGHFAWREARRLLVVWKRAIRISRRDPLDPGQRRASWRNVLDRPCTAAAAALLLFFLLAHWIRLQELYLSVLPPDQYSFLRILQAPPYRGASLISNTYANPMASATGQWAYADPSLCDGFVNLYPHGYYVDRRFPANVWFADRNNPAYARPEYLVVVTRPDLGAACQRILQRLDGREIRPLWQPDGIRAQCGQTGQTAFWHQLVAQDPSPWQRWAILKLDWDCPPYLAAFPEEESFVRGRVERCSDGTRVTVEYRYAHQEGVAESGTRVRILVHSEGEEFWLLDERIDQTVFYLPASTYAQILLSVTPSTSLKKGGEYFGLPVSIPAAP